MTRRHFLSLIPLLLAVRWEPPRRHTTLTWTTTEGETHARHFEQSGLRG